MAASNKRHTVVVPSRNWCECPDAAGDLREGTCIKCGRQVPGYEIPARPILFSLGIPDASRYARKLRKYGPAA